VSESKEDEAVLSQLFKFGAFDPVPQEKIFRNKQGPRQPRSGIPGAQDERLTEEEDNPFLPAKYCIAATGRNLAST
jgi:hypothetical protein